MKVVVKNSLKVIGKFTLVHEDGREEEIDGKRAWASDGRSLGLDAEVDVVIGNKEYNDEMHIQCKIRKRLPEYIFPKNDAIDSHVIRENRGEAYIVLRYDDYLAEMRRYRQLKDELELYKPTTPERT